MEYEAPDERALAHAQKVSFLGSADFEVARVENEFWHGFCHRSGSWAPVKYQRWTVYCLENPDRPGLIHFKNGSWHRVAQGQWEALRSQLWKEIVVEDLERVDHGPPRWKARAVGEIPPSYAVDHAALEALLSYGPDFSELSAEEQERQLGALRQSKDATFAPPPIDEAQSGAIKRRGRKPTIDWPWIEKRVIAHMEHNGEFFRGDADWDCQARLEEKLMYDFTTKFGKELSTGTLRAPDRLPAYLAKWREGRNSR